MWKIEKSIKKKIETTFKFVIVMVILLVFFCMDTDAILHVINIFENMALDG